MIWFIIILIIKIYKIKIKNGLSLNIRIYQKTFIFINIIKQIYNLI